MRTLMVGRLSVGYRLVLSLESGITHTADVSLTPGLHDLSHLYKGVGFSTDEEGIIYWWRVEIGGYAPASDYTKKFWIEIIGVPKQVIDTFCRFKKEGLYPFKVTFDEQSLDFSIEQIESVID